MNREDIITSDRFLSIAHNYISRKDTKINISPDKNVFFVKTDYLDFFVSNIAPKINFPFILITHESDYPIPGNHHSLLNHPFLLKWFGMNVHYILHDKLQPVPIGLANDEWPHGNKDTLLSVAEEILPRTDLVYCNYDISTNPNERTYALNRLSSASFITRDFNKYDFATYLRKVKTHKYIISPPGNSTDCHRVWEAIYLGTIPICLKSVPMVYFRDCPILFIDDWSQITEEFLLSKYETIKQKSIEKAMFSFYFNQINDLAKH